MVLGAVAPAAAQVTVNPAALQQLAGIAPPRPVAVQPQPVVHKVMFHHRKPVLVVAKPLAPLPKPKPAASPPPPAKALPPAPKPVTLSFAPGSADLPAGAALALHGFCTAPANIIIAAHAPRDASDQSAAMRLSLARALAVRDALSQCGVPPSRLIPQALGAAQGADADQTLISAGP
jgi:outer membrane protein OmpA-like peptidoglycan-associated protein